MDSSQKKKIALGKCIHWFEYFHWFTFFQGEISHLTMLSSLTPDSRDKNSNFTSEKKGIAVLLLPQSVGLCFSVFKGLDWIHQCPKNLNQISNMYQYMFWSICSKIYYLAFCHTYCFTAVLHYCSSVQMKGKLKKKKNSISLITSSV